ncbi:MAG TPA: hypothetical protein VIH36_06760 [Casimicrobiaceae bacterium]|jgi:hypothetical protein
MTNATWRRGAIVAALAIGACSDAPIAPGQQVSVAHARIAPWEVREACADVGVGDRIDFRFDATEAVDLDLYYRQGEAVIIPLSRKGTVADAGVLEVRIPGRYCLAFKAGPAGAFVSYHVAVRGED